MFRPQAAVVWFAVIPAQTTSDNRLHTNQIGRRIKCTCWNWTAGCCDNQQMYCIGTWLQDLCWNTRQDLTFLNCLYVFGLHFFYFTHAGKVKSTYLLFSNKICFTFTQKHTFRACQCSHRPQLIILQLHWNSWGFGGVSTLELISWFWTSDHFRGVFQPRKIASMHMKVFPNHRAFLCITPRQQSHFLNFNLKTLNKAPKKFLFLFLPQFISLWAPIMLRCVYNPLKLHLVLSLLPVHAHESELITETSCSHIGYLFSKCGASLHDAHASYKLYSPLKHVTTGEYLQKKLWDEVL